MLVITCVETHSVYHEDNWVQIHQKKDFIFVNLRFENCYAYTLIADDRISTWLIKHYRYSLLVQIPFNQCVLKNVHFVMVFQVVFVALLLIVLGSIIVC